VVQTEGCTILATGLTTCDVMPTRVQDKHDWVKGLTAEDAGWLSTLPFTLCLRDTLLVVHAGLVPGDTS
jgi:diadenosine tetraphosphatase ApaH/serine/threonine PP2A family protein phosphatase